MNKEIYTRVVLFTLFSFFILIKDGQSQEKRVMEEWENGNPKMIAYEIKGGAEIAKEEHFYENGNLRYYCEYKKGELHGECRYYYEEGYLWQVETYKKGLKHGRWVEFKPNGEIELEKLYKKDEQVPTKKQY